jgi:SNF2 family DNA or RNA helicase
VRHRVARQAHSVRKTDLGVRENFQGLQNVVVPIQMSEEDRRFYDVVEDLAKQAMETDQNLGPYYRVLRYICNNPESLHQTKDEVGQRILRDHPGSATAAHCAKLQILLDTVESIRDADDRCVVFTQWTNLSLFQLHDHLERRKIRHVLHYGAGQSARESQAAQQRFKRDRDITVFLSSDAGAFGLNLQECRYVINYEVPYSYDTWMQRINRIDRVDSYLENLTAYNFITEATVEERIWRILNQRRELAAATLGTNEELSYENENSPKTLSYLIFGEK